MLNKKGLAKSIDCFLLTSIIRVIIPSPLHVQNVHLSETGQSRSQSRGPANRNDRINYHFQLKPGSNTFTFEI